MRVQRTCDAGRVRTNQQQPFDVDVSRLRDEYGDDGRPVVNGGVMHEGEAEFIGLTEARGRTTTGEGDQHGDQAALTDRLQALSKVLQHEALRDDTSQPVRYGRARLPYWGRTAAGKGDQHGDQAALTDRLQALSKVLQHEALCDDTLQPVRYGRARLPYWGRTAAGEGDQHGDQAALTDRLQALSKVLQHEALRDDTLQPVRYGRARLPYWGRTAAGEVDQHGDQAALTDRLQALSMVLQPVAIPVMHDT